MTNNVNSQSESKMKLNFFKETWNRKKLKNETKYFSVWINIFQGRNLR